MKRNLNKTWISCTLEVKQLINHINTQTELDKLREHFFRAFKDVDPFGEMFMDSIEERQIICPFDSYSLDKKQFNALILSIMAVEDKGFYITEIEPINCFTIVEPPYYQPRSWYFELPISYEEYEQIDFYLETAIYSPTGRWGLMISHEDHAVIGGSNQFINTFNENYPNSKEGCNNFLEMWRANTEQFNSDISWMRKFLEHIKCTK
jgi:hypothetical protein